MNISTKSYQSLLPFMVVEAISSQNLSFNQSSVRMMDKGWAWLVSGRKLLVWKFNDAKTTTMMKTRRSTMSPCFELQLPQSDLIHKAELVNVFFLPQNLNTSTRIITVPAAVAISPEGTIRFWSNIANERPNELVVSDLQGQEFCTLAALSNTEYLIGTTTGSVFLLVLDTTSSDPNSVINCSSLEAPSGLLSGISRRMTNLFFGPMASDTNTTEARRPLVAVVRPQNESEASIERTFFVMSSSFKLRQWSRTCEGVQSQNRLVREWDLLKNIHRKLTSLLRIPESQTLNIWPVDCITTKNKELLILVVTLDTSHDNTINYATCVFNPFQASDRIGKTTVLQSHSWQYTNESEEQLLSLRFLERCANSPLCFMYDRKFLFLAQVDRDILDAVDYANQDDSILGAGFIDGQAVLFTQRDGLICVLPVVSDRSMIDPGNDTTIYQPDSSRMSNDTRELSTRLENSRHQSMSSRVEPMLVELDEEADDNRENDKPAMPTQPKEKADKDASMSSSMRKTNLDNSTLNKSVDQSTRRKADETQEFLRDNKEFEWVQQIDSKCYGQASETLARIAEEAETLKDRKETLLALSKLAKLAE